MTIVYRSEKGSPLTADEVDGNFEDLDGRVTTLETEGPLGIASIDSSEDGGSLTVTLTDDSTQGPFPLPVATFRPAGEWTNSTPYAYLDIVSVRSQGTFLVLANHTTPDAPAEFDPAASDSDQDFYFQIGEARDVDYDVAFSFYSTLPDPGSEGILLGQFVLVRTIVMAATLPAAGRAYLDTGPFSSDGEVEIDIEKNGISIGSIVFTDNEGAITFPSEVEFDVGDRVGLRLRATDGLAGDLSVTLPAMRTDI